MLEKNGEPWRTRTSDPLIKSYQTSPVENPVLTRLSSFKSMLGKDFPKLLESGENA